MPDREAPVAARQTRRCQLDLYPRFLLLEHELANTGSWCGAQPSVPRRLICLFSPAYVSHPLPAMGIPLRARIVEVADAAVLQHQWGVRFPMVPLHLEVHPGKGYPGQPRLAAAVFLKPWEATLSCCALPVQCTAVAANILMGRWPPDLVSVCSAVSRTETALLGLRVCRVQVSLCTDCVEQSLMLMEAIAQRRDCTTGASGSPWCRVLPAHAPSPTTALACGVRFVTKAIVLWSCILR